MKSGMHECKYRLHSSENCFVHQYYHESTKEGLVGSLGNRSTNLKEYQKSQNNWKRDMKSSKKYINPPVRASPVWRLVSYIRFANPTSLS